MATTVSRDGNNLVDKYGSPISEVNSDNDKYYAVIVKCGHAGEGYFIPIMYPINAKDKESAIEIVKKVKSRVQRDKPDCVLAVFEIDLVDYLLIELINEHDTYLKGFERKGDESNRHRRVYKEFSQRYMQSRIYNKRLDDREMKTADEYDDDYVLERTFAPRRQGDKIIPAPTNVKKDVLLREFYNKKCMRYGTKGDIALLSLYYQKYGRNNDLGLEYEPGYLHMFSEGKPRTWEVTDVIASHLDPVYQAEKKAAKEQRDRETYFSGRNINNLSQMEKFKRRMNAHALKNVEKTDPEENAPEPGER